MDLTFTNARFEDVGLLDVAAGDFAFGIDENDFDLILAGGSGVPEQRTLVYDESGVVGGIVRGYKSEEETGLLHVVGDTWTGLLDSRVLMPEGDYFKVSGGLKGCMEAVISNLGLGGMFVVSSETASVNVSHTFTGSRDALHGDTGRYMRGWQAMWQMLSDNGLKARFEWNPAGKRVVVTGLRRGDYTDAESIATGIASVNVSNRSTVNHLVCLGQGDLAARMVRHVYLDANGSASTAQTLTGNSEIADVYDDSSAGTESELIAHGKKKLADLYAKSQQVAIGVPDGSVDFDLGDLVGGTDEKTGVSAKAIVTKKVVSLDGDAVSAKYESTVRTALR